MSVEQIWIIILSVATPIAGVVGFAIQLRNVKKTRLENEKLSLEINSLKKEKEKNESNIVLPTNDEVSHIVHGKSFAELGRTMSKPAMSESHDLSSHQTNSSGGFLSLVGKFIIFVLLIPCLIGYLFYDLYRIFQWFVSLF
jgi:hypothetical protein